MFIRLIRKWLILLCLLGNQLKLVINRLKCKKIITKIIKLSYHSKNNNKIYRNNIKYKIRYNKNNK